MTTPRFKPHAIVAGLLFVAAGLATTIDLPIARWCAADGCPKQLAKLVDLAEVYGQGLGVALILITLAVLDRTRRWTVPRLALAAYGSGLGANVLKLLIARTRPHSVDLAHAESAWHTFGNWLPLNSLSSAQQSFPSSHVATAVGLTVALAWLYPWGRAWFIFLAMLVACQRMETGYHFLSDALVGAAVGVLVAPLCLALPSLGYLGNRLEAALGKPLARR